jgi:hypothetical protein
MHSEKLGYHGYQGCRCLNPSFSASLSRCRSNLRSGLTGYPDYQERTAPAVWLSAARVVTKEKHRPPAWCTTRRDQSC